MPQEYQLFYQRHLPHFQPQGATIFITFRLAGSLPWEVIQRIEEEARRKNAEIERIEDLHAERLAAYQVQKQLFGKWDQELDTSLHGPRWLAESPVAQLVRDALHYRDERVYTLEAYCIMPNHVHLVCAPMPSTDEQVYSISEIMQSLKGYTARQANRLLERAGDFWQHESYDHVVRDVAELQRVIDYVMQNPHRAGLGDKWVYCRTKNSLPE
jgi:REP element-mobilizing transposase RayT